MKLTKIIAGICIAVSGLSMNLLAQISFSSERLRWDELDDFFVSDDDEGNYVPTYFDAACDLHLDHEVSYFYSDGFLNIPFVYREVPPSSEASCMLIREHGAVISTPEDPIFSMVGPLSPCIGIILHNTENNHILVAHKSCESNLESLKPMVEALNISDPNNLRLTLYSRYMPEDKYKALVNLYLSYEISCSGHSQEEEHRVTYNFFRQLTGIPDSNVHDIIFVPLEEIREMDANAGVSGHLMVDPEGNISNTSPHLENYFNLEGAAVSLVFSGDTQKLIYDSLGLEQQLIISNFASTALANLTPLIKASSTSSCPDSVYGQYVFFNIRSLVEVSDTFFRKIDIGELLGE